MADPQGIRYETTNKSDAFSMKFAEIETFEVDYLKKNLVIKKRGGKQYNFTTKAANADPLFVFHRNVDKVRKQVPARRRPGSSRAANAHILIVTRSIRPGSGMPSPLSAAVSMWRDWRNLSLRRAAFRLSRITLRHTTSSATGSVAT